MHQVGSLVLRIAGGEAGTADWDETLADEKAAQGGKFHAGRLRRLGPRHRIVVPVLARWLHHSW